MGGKSARRGPDRRARFVPARRPVGQRRGDHRDRWAPSPIRCWRRPGTARMPPAGCSPRAAWGDPLAAGAGGGGLPDRRVPEDLLPRRDPAWRRSRRCSITSSLFLMVEIDARKLRHARSAIRRGARASRLLLRQYGFHFLSLVAIVVFMVMGFSPIDLGVLGDRGSPRLEFPAARLDRARSPRGLARRAGSKVRRRRRAGRGRHLRRRRHHRRRRDADRAGAQVQLASSIEPIAGGQPRRADERSVHRRSSSGSSASRYRSPPATSSAPSSRRPR